MNTLFDRADAAEILKRINELHASSQAKWGKMNVAQMLAHINISLETAIGIHNVKRLFSGRIIGTLLKKSVVGEKQFAKNSPTDKSYIFPADLQFEEQKSKLLNSLRKFSEGGPAGATTHPHPFFGKFTPEQWGILQWKHLDHHLRQFGV
jgi:hypothetical protein